MFIEKETIEFVASIIGEIDPKVPLEARKKIARRAIMKDKIADQKWLKNTISELECDSVFTQFSVIKHKKPFVEEYGEEALTFMKKHLKNPSRISPRWASHFMSTVKAVGIEVVATEQDVYAFVTKHPEWPKHRRSRNIYKGKKPRCNS